MNANVNAGIAIILGTRAELIKCFPIMREFKKRGIPYYFIHTGQKSLGKLYTEFGIRKPDVILTKEPEKGHKFGGNKPLRGIVWNLFLIRKIRRELKKLKKLKYVIYHGDTMTTASAAMASSRLLNPFKKYKNVHLESGLRSWDNKEPFPEEISRRISTRFSDVLFAPSKGSAYNLKKLKKKKILIYGNTIVDAAHDSLEIAKKAKIKPLSREKFALITIHRHENIRNKKRMEKIIDILSSVKIKAYLALHENTEMLLKRYGLLKKLKKNKKINVIRPRSYINFIYQISRCSLIICDGGSMQEESLIFHKPCILLRKSTERQEGLKANFQFLSKFDVEKTKEKIEEYLSPQFKMKKIKNPYGERALSKKIVDFLVK